MVGNGSIGNSMLQNYRVHKVVCISKVYLEAITLLATSNLKFTILTDYAAILEKKTKIAIRSRALGGKTPMRLREVRIGHQYCSSRLYPLSWIVYHKATPRASGCVGLGINMLHQPGTWSTRFVFQRAHAIRSIQSIFLMTCCINYICVLLSKIYNWTILYMNNHVPSWIGFVVMNLQPKSTSILKSEAILYDIFAETNMPPEQTKWLKLDCGRKTWLLSLEYISTCEKLI